MAPFRKAVLFAPRVEEEVPVSVDGFAERPEVRLNLLDPKGEREEVLEQGDRVLSEARVEPVSYLFGESVHASSQAGLRPPPLRVGIDRSSPRSHSVRAQDSTIWTGERSTITIGSI